MGVGALWRRPCWLLVVAAASGCRLGFDGRISDANGPADAAPATDASGYPPGLVARLALDDDPADGVDDASGRGHVAICKGGCPSVVAGHLGNGYMFNGITSYLEIANAADLSNTAGFTVTALIKWTPSAVAACVAAKQYGTAIDNSWRLCVRPGGDLIGCAVSSPGVSICALAPIGSVASGTWQHVAMTWDGATEQIWVGATSVASMPTTTLFDADSITIGADIDNGIPGYFFSGTIDDVQMYERALSASELADIAAR